MLIEIFNQQGMRVFYTEYAECVMDDIKNGTLLSMSKNKYKFKIDSKPYSYKTFVEKLKEIYKQENKKNKK